MMIGRVLFNLAAFTAIAALIAFAAYFVDLRLFSASRELSSTDALFLEGLGFVIMGLLLLMGRGGINLYSQKAALLSALAGAVYKKGTVGPSEQLRRDAWKPQGFVRIALILIFAGVFMLLIYFLTL